jgi:hypothetical protein
MNLKRLEDLKRNTEETQSKILVAQEVVHQGAMFGILSSGGKKSVGNYIIEIVANGGKFVTFQIYQTGLGVKPKVQSWQKTKTVVEKQTVYKKPPKEQVVKREFKNEGTEDI